eukprot:TRINITY_DN13650_c0_g1_i1.p1 TRINITY_DN13650_c0_g1~~TRINITY_DN13650_c0_g1_i1.p1  ORF type:complete len:116 (+),score=49.41 TRINITY_DN13650_c0_g1_i1:136-483(+)
MEAWRNLGQEPVICHNRMRAVSLGEEDTASITSKMSNSSSDPDVSAGNNNNSGSDMNADSNDNTFSLKTYISSITSGSEPAERMKWEVNRSDVNEAENRSMSWKERMNDYSFMKR